MQTYARAPKRVPGASSVESRGDARACSCLLQFRIRVAHRRQIGRARSRVQFAEQRVVALLCFELGDATVRVVGVAENDGAGRASGFASGNNFAVLDRTVLLFGF